MGCCLSTAEQKERTRLALHTQSPPVPIVFEDTSMGGQICTMMVCRIEPVSEVVGQLITTLEKDWRPNEIKLTFSEISMTPSDTFYQHGIEPEATVQYEVDQASVAFRSTYLGLYGISSSTNPRTGLTNAVQDFL